MPSTVRFVLLAALMAPIVSASAPWLTATEYNEVLVVVSPDASPSEHRAAEVFQEYWERCTAYRPDIASQPVREKVNVWIGRAGNPYADELELAGLGDDGLCIRTFDASWRKRIRSQFGVQKSLNYQERRALVIAGGTLRGTLYGVYEFFERYMGVRWLTPHVTHIPSPPEAIPAIDHRYVPPFMYREVFYRTFRENPEFAVAYKQNGNSMGIIPEAWGGHIGFAGGFGHTFYGLVEPDVYWEEHPEYFSEVNGERQRKSQLCMTNPDVLDIVIDRVRGILRENPPNCRIVSVTQMDWPFWCECATCSAVEEEEGSHSGPLIRFVNAVAEAIEEEFPDAFIDTFAYTWSRKPPKHARPRENVIIRLCSIEADFSKPLSDKKSPYNRAFQEDIEAWSRIAPNLFVWDYTQNWYAFQAPHPNFHVLQPNVKFFADHGVVGLFEQASPTSPHSDYEHVKGYILGHAVWNPDVDWRALYDEFLTLYYREAAPYIRAYHELITQKVLDDEYYLSFLNRVEWMDFATIEKAQAIFEDAFEAVQSDEIRERLKYAYLPVQYAALTAPPEIEVLDDKLILRRPPSQTFDEYWAMLMDYGVTAIGDEGIHVFRERLDATTLPRYQELALLKLRNDRYGVWTVPAWGGAIVRLQDLETGMEWFQLFDQWNTEEGSLREWTVMDPLAPVIEEAAVDAYEVVEHSPERLVLRSALENGLELTRTMILPEGDAPLDLQLTFTNTGTETVTPRIKLHPEFWTHDEKTPEVWVQTEEAWRSVPLSWAEEDQVALGTVHAEGVSRWALHLPKAKATLVNTVESDDIDQLFYFYARKKDFLNLEVVPKAAPLAPGESRQLHVNYASSARPPDKL